MRKHIGFGCVTLTTFPFKQQAIRLLNTVYDQGITLFDTAPLYGKGYSEKIVGEFSRGKRDKLVISTKFGLGDNFDNRIPISVALFINYLNKLRKSNSFKTIIPHIIQSESLQSYRKIQKNSIQRSLEQSLHALRTDYIDNYLLHEGLPGFLTEDSLDYLFKMKENGTIKKLGIACSFTNFKQENNYQDWDILQYEFIPDFKSKLDFYNQHTDKLHIFHSILKPLAQGIKSVDISSDELAGFLLMHAIISNPCGKVLFSTTKEKNLIKNLSVLDKYKNIQPNKLDKLIQNAIS
ncbi:aldo/keto reductase (plasmid) [Pedobacter sp. BS3]|uniref:aldo/keto reductase n=1 Tax=Pedobacter sp. BS3 TaxID=2567937 RepID=UPI0011EC8E26|nr:aldo/keto reductase [Pedobacter sp. BS3]TZF86211.1 aldo/keto reductase [Pedobacter sp. BS3]